MAHYSMLESDSCARFIRIWTFGSWHTQVIMCMPVGCCLDKQNLEDFDVNATAIDEISTDVYIP